MDNQDEDEFASVFLRDDFQRDPLLELSSIRSY